MRVVVDASFLGAQRGGDETFLLGLLEGLSRQRGRDDTFPVMLAGGAAPPCVRDDPAFPVVPVPQRTGLRHFLTTAPAAWRAAGGDLLLTTTHAPIGSGVPSALILGDLSFLHRPADYPPATRARLRLLVPRHVRTARAILVPSEFTRADVVTTLGVDASRVHVVPNRVEPPTPIAPAVAQDIAAAMARAGVRSPFLLYLGNLHRRKNVPLLIRAFRRARLADPQLRDHQLVVAGGRWFAGDDEGRAAAGDPAIVLTGRVDDDQRNWLLQHAAALAYVSLFEGFGLPPLEAMACGTPVLTSDRTSLPEVTGGAALLVDPADESAVAAGVGRILTDHALRARLRRDGPARAAHYDADRAGRAALAALRCGVPSTGPQAIARTLASTTTPGGDAGGGGNDES